jgi:hypothetical protein
MNGVRESTIDRVADPPEEANNRLGVGKLNLKSYALLALCGIFVKGKILTPTALEIRV